MKKLILMSLLLVAGLRSNAQFQESIETQKKQTSIEKIESITKTSAKSNPNFVPGYMDTYKHNGLDYELEGRNSYTYLYGNEIGEDLLSFWDEVEQEFYPYYRRIYNRTSTFNSTISESYNSIDEKWIPIYTDTSFIDEFGFEIKNVYYSYDEFSGNWSFNWGEVTEIVYNETNNPTEFTYLTLNQNGTTTLSYREVWIWDGGNGPSEFLYQEWDETEENWVTEMKAINLIWFDFLTFKIMNAEIYYWNEDQWIPEWKIEGTYFENGVFKEITEYEWDFEDEFVPEYKEKQTIDDKGLISGFYSYDWDEEWILYEGTEYENSYDEDFNLIQQLLSNYFYLNEIWITGDKLVYGDYNPLAVNTQIKDDFFTVYPNPVKDRITIQSANELNNVFILDALGNKVHSSSVENNEVSIDVTSFKNGIYFIQLINNKGVVTRKIVKN